MVLFCCHKKRQTLAWSPSAVQNEINRLKGPATHASTPHWNVSRLPDDSDTARRQLQHDQLRSATRPSSDSDAGRADSPLRQNWQNPDNPRGVRDFGYQSDTGST